MKRLRRVQAAINDAILSLIGMNHIVAEMLNEEESMDVSRYATCLDKLGELHGEAADGIIKAGDTMACITPDILQELNKEEYIE